MYECLFCDSGQTKKQKKKDKQGAHVLFSLSEIETREGKKMTSPTVNEH